MFNNNFGIEVEFTGITRDKAARITAEFLGGTITNEGDYYDTKKVTAPDGRVWKLMFDSTNNLRNREDTTMTKQEYTKYTGLSYMSRYRNPKDAIRLSMNKYNLCKTKVIILDDGTYGVCQNSLAKKFFRAGYKEYFIGFAEAGLK